MTKFRQVEYRQALNIRVAIGLAYNQILSKGLWQGCIGLSNGNRGLRQQTNGLKEYVARG